MKKREWISLGAQQAIDLWRTSPMLNVPQVARMVGISHTTLYRLIKKKKLKRILKT